MLVIIIFVICQGFMVSSGNSEIKDIATHQLVEETMSQAIIVTECDNGDDRGA